MNIGVLHISDLHIENHNYSDKIIHMVNACRYDINNASCLYIVITGDIVKYGRKEEYDKAKEFLEELKDKIKPQNSILQIQLILVPGNHDCCFDNVNKTRSIIIKNCKVDRLEEDDYFNAALTPQENFWNFYKEMKGNNPIDKISYENKFSPRIDTCILFHCYNTSWMSEISETYGDIVIPENKFLQREGDGIIISLFHHPINWLSPDTKNNNKSRFEEHLLSSANIVLYGHEHDKGKPKNMIQKGNNVVFCEGKAFQKAEGSGTGFSYLDIDIDNKILNTKVYSWTKEDYILEVEEEFVLTPKENRKYKLSEDFKKKIDSLSIPLKHSKKNDLSLMDIFVFPDLEPIKDDDIIQYPNSEEILIDLKNEKITKAFIEGDDQSGKTTLLFAYYRKLYDMGFSPIYIRGKHTNTTNVKDIVKKAIKDQYEACNVNSFLQQGKVVFLLDNLHKSPLNSKHRAILFQNLNTQFTNIIITTNTSLISNLATEELNILKDFEKYKLLPLGHEKRGELIEQWIRIGENELTIRDEELLNQIKTRLDEINLLLGNRLMPSYPIFILTLLQGLDAQIFPQDYTQTSYAHCYHALITAGLVREGLKDQLNGYFNLLKELSFYLFDNEEEKEVFNYSSFEKFYNKFKNNYFISHTPAQILEKLRNANILKFDDEYYSFSYKYIFYYLVAQKIASNIEKNNDLIEKLCENIHLEKNANILIFLSHHTKAQLLLDNIIFASELPFEKSNPITLDKGDPFTTFISEFVQTVKNDIIEERNPKDEVKKELQKKDKIEQKKSVEERDNQMPPELIEINQAFRAIKILGQIVKNQKGDFEKEKLIELVDSAYRTCFRFIGFFTNMLQEDKDIITEAISDELDKRSKNIDRNTIEKQVLTFLQFISYRLCIDSFTNLMFSVGTKGVDELYSSVTENINTSAAKIVTFAIKSYYGSINTTELEKLFKEVDNNHIAQSILRIYVRKHLYTNFVERTKRERIIKIAGFKANALLPKKKNNP